MKTCNRCKKQKSVKVSSEQRAKYNNTEGSKASRQKWSKNNQYKKTAYMSIFRAVKRGDIPEVHTQECYHCRDVVASHYHHPDYKRPLFVVPLCRKCHAKEHANER